MKNLLKLSLAIILLFSFTGMKAQVKFGPKAGVNFSTMTLKSAGVGLDPKALIGFHAGVIAEIPLTDVLKFQPGFLYSSKGAKYKISTYDISMSPGFIEVPLNIVYDIDLSGAKLGLFAGPYFGYGVGGKAKAQDESEALKFGSGEDNDMKPVDFGINIGAGMNVAGLLISAQYQIGLANLAPVTENDAEMKIKGFSVSVAYLFGTK